MRRMNRKPYCYQHHGVVEAGETEEAQKLRFQVELEFVQCLANPNYLNFLAQRGYFKEQTFINYIKYLQYWKEPDYAKYLKYPLCLYFLDLLQHENFRKEIVNGQCCKFIDDQMILHWQHYTRKRMKLMETGINQQEPPTPSSQTSSVIALPTVPSAPSPASNMLNGYNQAVGSLQARLCSIKGNRVGTQMAADKIVLSFHDALVRESDLKLLEGRNWLNDSLISFWFEYLHYEVFKDCPGFLFISPEVTQLLKMGDPSELPLFLDPLDAIEKNLIFLPVNDNSSVVSSGGSHWSLLVYSKFDNKWFHYDSQRGSNYRDARCLVQRMNTYLKKEENATLQDAMCTQQDNSYDCGAFVMIYAQRIPELALKGLDVSSCFVQRQEANQIRESIFAIVNSLKS